jgi:hypothetical protein
MEKQTYEVIREFKMGDRPIKRGQYADVHGQKGIRNYIEENFDMLYIFGLVQRYIVPPEPVTPKPNYKLGNLYVFIDKKRGYLCFNSDSEIDEDYDDYYERISVHDAHTLVRFLEKGVFLDDGFIEKGELCVSDEDPEDLQLKKDIKVGDTVIFPAGTAIDNYSTSEDIVSIGDLWVGIDCQDLEEILELKNPGKSATIYMECHSETITQYKDGDVEYVEIGCEDFSKQEFVDVLKKCIRTYKRYEKAKRN